MMKIALMMIMITALAMKPAFADIPEITNVDFYPNGAKFIFTMQSDSDSFTAEIPGAFELSSVRMTEPDKYDDVKVTKLFREDWIPQALEPMHTELEAVNQTIGDLRTRLSALEHTRELLKNAAPPTRTDAKDIISYITMSSELKEETEKEIAQIKFEIDEAVEKAEIMQEELNERSPGNSNSVIHISGHVKEGNVIQFEAFTNHARWNPEYVMDLNSQTGKITTRINSRASQRTGLDYTGTLIFHTRRANTHVSAPDLHALRVSIKPKERERNDYMLMRSAPMAEPEFNAFVSSPARPKAPEPQMQATLSDHTIAGTGTLTGDNTESLFMHGELELIGKVMLELIPELRSDAYILVNMESNNTALIPADAELRVDGMPAGKTSIPEYGLSQKKIAFGYAPQITCKKEPVITTKGSSWFSGTNSGGYTLKVTNGMNDDRHIIIRDRLPIPTDDRIKLEVKRIEPEPKERDRENKLTWELDLKAGETKIILVDYTLSYPSNEELEFSR